MDLFQIYLVNPKNPRFDPLSSQAQAIQKMLTEKESEIKYLAEDIMEKGLNPSKNVDHASEK